MTRSPQTILNRGLILLIAFLSFAPAAAARIDPLTALDDAINTAMDDWEVPGLAIAIVKDDKIVFMKGYGVQEIGKGQRVDENTVFAIGSTTKAFTSAAMALLVHDKKLSWDDHVVDRLPGFQFYDPWVTREMTVRDLLSNRSGLGAESEILWYATDLSRNDIVRRLRYVKPQCSFRSCYAYRNTMFLAAGQLIPAVTGMSWDDFVKERIFRPLGMTRSNTSVKELGGMDNLATPHTKINGQVVSIQYRNIDNIGPAGSINSSVRDMAQWLRFQLADGAYNGTPLVDSAVLEETHRPHTPLPMTPAAVSRFPTAHFMAYCLGWLTFDYQGQLVVWHNGEIDGMHAVVGFAPEKNVGIVILTNYDSQNMHEALFLRVLDGFLNRAPGGWNAMFLESWKEQESQSAKSLKEIAEARIQGTKPSLPIEAYTGSYENDLYGKISISRDENGLVLKFSSALVGDLEHWHYDTFRSTWRDKVADVKGGKYFLTFGVDAGGRVSQVSFDAGLVFKRTTDPLPAALK